jgi:hypothetical protein
MSYAMNSTGYMLEIQTLHYIWEIHDGTEYEMAQGPCVHLTLHERPFAVDLPRGPSGGHI